MGKLDPWPDVFLVGRFTTTTGPGRVAISGLPTLTVLDPRNLSADKREQAAGVFRHFQALPLLPANEAYRDATRHALDRALLIEILEFSEDVLPPLDNLRRQWCSEPSVHGGKSTSI